MHNEKLLNAVLFFIENINNGTLGKVKLAKLLFFADAMFYLNHGRSFLNTRFKKYPNGPVPLKFDKMLNNWDEYFIMEENEYFGYDKTNFILNSNNHANVDVFNEDELDSLKNAFDQFYDDSGNVMSDFSHKILPWDSIPEYADIPLKLVAFSQNNPIVEENGKSITSPEALKALENVVDAA